MEGAYLSMWYIIRGDNLEPSQERHNRSCVDSEHSVESVVNDQNACNHSLPSLHDIISLLLECYALGKAMKLF